MCMSPARYVSDLPVLQGEWALIGMWPSGHVADFPGIHGEWTLRTRF